MTTKRNTFLSTGLALGIAIALLGVLLVTSIALAAISTGFESGEPTGWTNNGAYYSTTASNAHTGSGYAGMNSTNDWIRTTQETNPAVLTFWARASWTTSNWTVEVQTSPDATTWTTQASYSADGNDTGDITYAYSQKTVNLNLTGDYYIRWEMTSRSGGSFYLDDVTLTNADATPSYSISKSAPDTVAPGEVFTYTLTIENKTGVTPTTTTITDVIPSGAGFISASNGGAETGGAVTWSVSNFADGATISRTFMVTATGSHGDKLENANYYVNGGTDWLTTTTGTTVTTQIADCSDIYHIQYPGGDSLCVGETVVVTGTVYAVYGSDFALANASGPWHGIYVDNSSDTPSIGDQIQVEGTVEESDNFTRIAWITHTVSVTGTTPYAASVVNSGDIATGGSEAESYEGVLVEVHDTTVTDDNLGYGEWSVDDGSGDVRVDDLGYAYAPTNGEALAVVRGMLYYSYSNYKIEPRDADDIVPVTGSGLLISKDAPTLVAPGALFTYTLTVENYTGATLNDVIITDTVPNDATFAYALDSGVESNGVVSWTVVSLPHTQSLTVQFAVTATTAEAVIYNDDYAVSASGIITPTRGATVITAVGDGLSIHHIQGNGAASPLDGQSVADVEGIVTAVHAQGFYMQEPDADANPKTSEGIYVYTNSAPTVNVGDLAEVDGEVVEYSGMTQLEYVTVITTSSGHTITATEVTLPLVQADDYEAYEGMLVTFSQELTVNDLYDLGTYGNVRLSQGGRLFNPTNVITPGTEAQTLQAANDLRTLLLDDGSSSSYPDPIPYPAPALSTTNTLRSGDTVMDLEGVLSYEYGIYRLHPTVEPAFVHDNPRPTAPTAVPDQVRVASFNVLNYFNGDGQGGGFPTSRGADTLLEFQRQRAKIIAAILEMDADVIGLMEIENDGYGQYGAIQDLVNGLNDAALVGTTYAFVDPGVAQIGTDEIAVGLIYKSNTVSLAGTSAILDSTTAISGTTFDDTKNRPALAQSFRDTHGEVFTVVVNHLKSKGSACGVGDDVPDYEGGNCNGTRTEAAEALVAWLATDPTSSGDPDALIIGDLNAYAMEDPISALKTGGYTDLVRQYGGMDAYSYVFMGQAGYLDHALANPSMRAQIADTTVWHINADEPRALDYNDDEANDNPAHYAADPYRASDHDPVIIGLELKPPEYNIYLPLVFRNSS